MKQRNLTYIILTVTFVFISIIAATAQPDDNGGDPGGSDVPLDGGTSLLIAAGIGYGIKKIKDSRNRKQ